ncbi:hypothetical protein G7Y31_06850 [Corynebacterium lizhenjunii]|uniref:Uncharacterized protein n=1 Tax=Corynebacterium lizhenjunii TaxID=2709394 RepID=A0A7T0KEN7_9CORY|nr:hypothetical protein [Corynebacterium lizhenjunii]QPK78303.1 hypothetical protein G7Y31_06850 [Corynebacterium lizhenjunii]
MSSIFGGVLLCLLMMMALASALVLSRMYCLRAREMVSGANPRLMMAISKFQSMEYEA